MVGDRRAERADIRSVSHIGCERREDWLAVEEPLEIRLRRGDVTDTLLTTMRTPGNDRELVAGLLFAEAVLDTPGDAVEIAHSEDPRVPVELRVNTIIVTLSPGAGRAWQAMRRPFLMNSACGVCGRFVIEDLRKNGFPTLSHHWNVARDLLYALPDAIRDAQAVFERTGGLHASALFDLSGTLLSLHEDIGRHNATDKLIGEQWLMNNVPLDRHIVLVSGRAGFEIVQKCLRAGVSLLASVGAPSSLAVDLALEAGMTLVGFLRNDRFNVYSGPSRIRL